jgi:hypothetical protein
MDCLGLNAMSNELLLEKSCWHRMGERVVRERG